MSLCNCLPLMTPGTFCPFCTQKMVFISWCSPFLHGRLRRLKTTQLLKSPLGNPWLWLDSKRKRRTVQLNPTFSALPPKRLQSCRRRSKGEQRKSMRVRTLHLCNFKMELHCSKKYVWDGWIKRMWDCCCWKWSGGAPCLTAVQQQEEGIWVHEEEDEEEVEEEVQLYERFRPSSWGLFRQKTNITRPIIDRCCCSGYKTQPKHGSEAKKWGAPVSSTGQQTYTTLNHLTTT